MSRILAALLIFVSFQIYATTSGRVFLMSRAEYKDLEANNKLIKEAVKNIYGFAPGDLGYKMDIFKAEIKQGDDPFIVYFPDPEAEKKLRLVNQVLKNEGLSYLTLRIKINLEKSILKKSLRDELDEDNTFEINMAVVGSDQVFVTEPLDKQVYNEMLEKGNFVDKTFKKYFGENVFNLNYHIEVLQTTACLIRDISKLECSAIYTLSGTRDEAYESFVSQITSFKFRNSFVYFDVLVSKEKSRLIQKADDAVITDADKTEHIRFYYCAPENNAMPGYGTLREPIGRLVNLKGVPVASVEMLLKDSLDNTVSTVTTDVNGMFTFVPPIIKGQYKLQLGKNAKEQGYYLFSKSDKQSGEFKKENNQFHCKLTLLNNYGTAPSLTDSDFISNIKARLVVVANKTAPLNYETVELVDEKDNLLQSKKTDENGGFEFNGINLKEIYTIRLPNYKEKIANERIYLANSKNELLARVNKNESGKFSYKVIPGEAHYITEMIESDVSFTFIKKKAIKPQDIVIREMVYFDLNSFELNPQAKGVLDKILLILTDHPEFKLEVISHTDARGDLIENQKLSLKRSEVVVNYFVTSGIHPLRLTPKGEGETIPLNACTDGAVCTEDEHKMNRRTEFKFFQ
jgi:outer membrane protein OmpA-like peptidoglycan-associated protein